MIIDLNYYLANYKKFLDEKSKMLDLLCTIIMILLHFWSLMLLTSSLQT